MALGSILGQLVGLHHQVVSLHHDGNEHLDSIVQHLGTMVQHLEEMPEKIADQIVEKMPKPEAPPPPPPPDGVMSYMRTAKELAQALLPLGLLAALVMGKATWSDVLPIIRTALGVH